MVARLIHNKVFIWNSYQTMQNLAAQSDSDITTSNLPSNHRYDEKKGYIKTYNIYREIFLTKTNSNMITWTLAKNVSQTIMFEMLFMLYRCLGPFQISYYFEYYKRRTKSVLQFTY